jgi:hypothetical protein
VAMYVDRIGIFGRSGRRLIMVSSRSGAGIEFGESL